MWHLDLFIWGRVGICYGVQLEMEGIPGQSAQSDLLLILSSRITMWEKQSDRLWIRNRIEWLGVASSRVRGRTFMAGGKKHRRGGGWRWCWEMPIGHHKEKKSIGMYMQLFYDYWQAVPSSKQKMHRVELSGGAREKRHSTSKSLHCQKHYFLDFRI